LGLDFKRRRSGSYDITIDPRYSWVAATEAVLKEMKA